MFIHVNLKYSCLLATVSQSDVNPDRVKLDVTVLVLIKETLESVLYPQPGLSVSVTALIISDYRLCSEFLYFCKKTHKKRV